MGIIEKALLAFGALLMIGLTFGMGLDLLFGPLSRWKIVGPGTCLASALAAIEARGWTGRLAILPGTYDVQGSLVVPEGVTLSGVNGVLVRCHAPHPAGVVILGYGSSIHDLAVEAVGTDEKGRR